MGNENCDHTWNYIEDIRRKKIHTSGVITYSMITRYYCIECLEETNTKKSKNVGRYEEVPDWWKDKE